MKFFENIRLGSGEETAYHDRAYCNDRVHECLRLVNLAPEVADMMPGELSGGMRKRVGIARAIAGKPTYLLYDEPTSGLDPVNADAMDALIEQLQKELNVTSVVVSHDVRGSFRVADRIALLHDGKIRLAGPSADFLSSHDDVVRAFLDRDFQLLETGH
jgi:phospholipid/cholesterol/gamma-HCH transport system ATP-binding protein